MRRLRSTCRWVTVLTLTLSACGSPRPPAGSPGAAPEDPGTTISVAIGGDVSLGGSMNAYASRSGGSELLAVGIPQLRDADLSVVNLEGVVASGGVQGIDKGQISPFYFRGRPETLAVLKVGGIDGVATANNHSGDYGPEALLEQDRLLDAMGIAHPGSGANRAEACAPAFLQAKGTWLALFSVDTTQYRFGADHDHAGTCHLAIGDQDEWRATFEGQIAEAHRHAHAVLFYVNWGPSFATSPRRETRLAGRLLIEMGADAVFGDNAHRIQGMEVVDGRPIIYDAGTTLFNFPEPDDSAVWLLTIGPSGVTHAAAEPLISEQGRTRPASPSEAERILAKIDMRSAALGTQLDDGALDLSQPSREPPSSIPAMTPRVSGPAPDALSKPPSDCIAATVPHDAAISPIELGPLTLIGIRVTPKVLPDPALLWVESFWRVDAPVTDDLWLAPRAYPAGGRLTPWGDPHQPCDWEWPVQRWLPGVIYRDRVPLRPPDDALHLGGLVALLSGGLNAPLSVTLGVADGPHMLRESDALAYVQLGLPLPIRVGLVGVALGLVAAVAFWLRLRRNRSRRATRSRS
jgi:poly-gamma-glutamate capsule biosynthesis protein CapA/YwtB (metallophosphatase superfamily)